jgi:serine phosphatase RsbU (regulator of sigma subunit)
MTFSSLRLRILAAICVLPIISFLLNIIVFEILESRYLHRDGEKYGGEAVLNIFTDSKNQPTKEQLKRDFNIALSNRSYDIFYFVVFNDRKNIIDARNLYVFCEESESCLDVYIKSYNEAIKSNKEFGIKEIGDGIYKFYIYTYYDREKEVYISIAWYKYIWHLFGERIHIVYIILGSIFFIPLFFGMFIFGIFFTPKIINPLRLLSKQLSNLSYYNFITGDASELKKDLPLQAKDEIGQLSRAFALMTENLTSNIRQLVETTARTERMQSDLNVARDIQHRSLPKNFAFHPEKKIELHAEIFPAREVGGDLYNFFEIDEKNICITIGDVVGKGVPAALMMTVVKKLIDISFLQKDRWHSPGEIINQLNEFLCYGNQNLDYVTLFFGILDVTTGELRYVNCGHAPQPLFTNGGNIPFFRKEVSGPPVGSTPDISYKEFMAVLPPGEAILLCTDGVTEAMNKEEQLFGDKRLLESFARMQGKPCKEVIDGILREVRAHAGEEPQSDDITMLMIRWGAENKTADVAREQKQKGS